jgi:hypothetical protein
MGEGNKRGSRSITVTWIVERDECEEEHRSNAKEIEGYIMGSPRNHMFPCSPREHNAQAAEIAPVTVARDRVFHKGRGKA